MRERLSLDLRRVTHPVMTIELKGHEKYAEYSTLPQCFGEGRAA